MTTSLKFHFSYLIGLTRGTCVAVSAKQAIDRARVDYLKTTKNIDSNSPRFRLEKSRLNNIPVILHLADEHLKRYTHLYRAYKDGDCTPAETQELLQIQSILNNESLK